MPNFNDVLHTAPTPVVKLIAAAPAVYTVPAPMIKQRMTASVRWVWAGMYIDVGLAGHFGPSPMSILFDSETGLHLCCVCIQSQVLAFAAFGRVTALRFTRAVPNSSYSWSAVHGDEEPIMQAYAALSETFVDIISPNQELDDNETPWKEIAYWMDDILTEVMGCVAWTRRAPSVPPRTTACAIGLASGVLKNWVPLQMTSRESFRVKRYACFDSGFKFMCQSTEAAGTMSHISHVKGGFGS